MCMKRMSQISSLSQLYRTLKHHSHGPSTDSDESTTTFNTLSSSSANDEEIIEYLRKQIIDYGLSKSIGVYIEGKHENDKTTGSSAKKLQIGEEATYHRTDRHHASIRGRMWQLMLNSNHTSISIDEYIKLCCQGECVKYEKIRVDVARTYPKDIQYNSVVESTELIRLLNTFVLQYNQEYHHQNNNHTNHEKSMSFTYIQGMNSLAAPFLYTLPEYSAYHTFCSLIIHHIPYYYQSSHIGVHAGCRLIDSILDEIDSELSVHLRDVHSLSAYIYAFSPVSSLCASVPPLDHLLQIWDFLYATSPSLCIVCIASQILLIRDQLLRSHNPKSILDYRVWPRLNAHAIIEKTKWVIERLSDDLLIDVMLHASDQTTAEKYAERKLHTNNT